MGQPASNKSGSLAASWWPGKTARVREKTFTLSISLAKKVNRFTSEKGKKEMTIISTVQKVEEGEKGEKCWTDCAFPRARVEAAAAPRFLPGPPPAGGQGGRYATAMWAVTVGNLSAAPVATAPRGAH